MPVLKESLVVKNKSLKEVFDYVADFANISQWDPGCLKSEKKGMGGSEAITIIITIIITMIITMMRTVKMTILLFIIIILINNHKNENNRKQKQD